VSAKEPGRDGGSREGGVHRRGFFTEGFRHLLKPLADLVESRVDRVDLPEWMAEEEKAPESRYGRSAPYPSGESTAATLRVIRPPGALPEVEFAKRCTGCAECVKVCPVSAIHLVYSADPLLDRKPAIDPATQACVVCDDLSCMKVCPTGALQSLSREEIRMGLAVLRKDVCLRTTGEDCQICVDKCPLGSRAIDIPHMGAPVEVRDGCVGCGVCEMYCPTQPRAIVVEPLPKPNASA